MDGLAADVIVVGAGNAGLTAAHAARERGCGVLVLEKADPAWSGGNSAFTAGAFRLAHDGLEDLRGVAEAVDDGLAAATDLDPYPAEAFLADLRRVTLGRGDPEMARILVADSGPAIRWLAGRGLRFRLMYERQAHAVEGRHRFWGGLALGTVDGGEGLMAQHRAAAERTGIEIRHGAAVEDLARDEAGAVAGVVVRADGGGRETLGAGAVVLAAGGFESDPRRRATYLGPEWDVAKVRGTPHNTGEVLDAALAHGAQAYGHWSGCHAIQWDAGAPPTGDRALTNRWSRQSYPHGIVVNRRGERFLDEGADFRNYTYARFGAEVLRQPEGARRAGLRLPRRHVAAHDRLRGAGRHAGRRRHARRAGRRPRDRPRALRAHRARLQRGDPARRLRPVGQGRQARPRGSRRRSPTGRCRSTIRRSSRSPSPAGSRSRSGACGSTPTPACSTAAGVRCRGCAPPASSSAGCSSTTTRAAAG